MSTPPTAALADFLEAKATEVKRIETEAEDVLHGKGDQAGYESLMRRKAELLSNIAADAAPLATALGRGLSDAATERLGGFSNNAAMALKVGSVFFMSALLYPDEHKPGEPNNLELLAAEVRGWA